MNEKKSVDKASVTTIKPSAKLSTSKNSSKNEKDSSKADYKANTNNEAKIINKKLPNDKIKCNSKDGRPSLVVSIELDLLNLCTNLLDHMTKPESSSDFKQKTKLINGLNENSTVYMKSGDNEDHGDDYNNENTGGHETKSNGKPAITNSTASVIVSETSTDKTGSSSLKRSFNDESSSKQLKKQKIDVVDDSSSHILNTNLKNSLNNINSNITNNNSLFTNNNSNTSSTGKQVSIGTNTTSNTKLSLTATTVNPTTAIVKPMHHGDVSTNKHPNRTSTIHNAINKPKLCAKFDFLEA